MRDHGWSVGIAIMVMSTRSSHFKSWSWTSAALP
jgi:hypothetical protein